MDENWGKTEKFVSRFPLHISFAIFFHPWSYVLVLRLGAPLFYFLFLFSCRFEPALSPARVFLNISDSSLYDISFTLWNKVRTFILADYRERPTYTGRVSHSKYRPWEVCLSITEFSEWVENAAKFAILCNESTGRFRTNIIDLEQDLSSFRIAALIDSIIKKRLFER